MRASAGRAGKSRGMAYGDVTADEVVQGDLWLDHQDGQTLGEAEAIAEAKFIVEKAKGTWMGEPDRTVKRTSKAVYLGTRCTQDGGFSVELAHRLNQGNRAWIRHRARLMGKQWTRAMRLEAFFGLVVPAILPMASNYDLSTEQWDKLDSWYCTRLRVLMSLDFTTTGQTTSYAATLQAVDECRGVKRPTPLLSTMARCLRLGLLGRLIRLWVKADRLGKPIPRPILAVFGCLALPPKGGRRSPQLDTEWMAGRGCPGSWVRHVLRDMDETDLSLQDAICPGRWKRLCRQLPDFPRHFVWDDGVRLSRSEQQRRAAQLVPQPLPWEEDLRRAQASMEEFYLITLADRMYRPIRSKA